MEQDQDKQDQDKQDQDEENDQDEGEQNVPFVRDPIEDNDTFNLRLQYTQAIIDQLHLSVEEATVLGYMAIKKFRYGIKYAPESEHRLRQIRELLFPPATP